MEREVLTEAMIKEIFKETKCSIDKTTDTISGNIWFCDFKISKDLYDRIFFEAKRFADIFLDDSIDEIYGFDFCFCFSIFFKNCHFDEKINRRSMIEKTSAWNLCYFFECYAAYDCNCEFDGIAMVCPEKGAFIAYKSVVLYDPDIINEYRFGDDHMYKRAILELLIPADAKRSSGRTNKCRCSKAKAIGLYSMDDLEPITLDEGLEIVSTYDFGFKYEIGKMILPDGFEENRWHECSHGIHFFMTKEEVAEYARRR